MAKAVWVAAGPRADDPLLSEALDVVTSSDRPRGAKHWVNKLPGKLRPLRQRLAERLVPRGILGEERKELLGVTLSRRYPEKDPAPERALHAPHERADRGWRARAARRAAHRPAAPI